MLPIEVPDPHALDLLHGYFSDLVESDTAQMQDSSELRELPQILRDKGSCHALRKQTVLESSVTLISC